MNARSLARLKRADSRLERLFIEAAKRPPIEFEVSETLRTKLRQRELVAVGASWTMNSRHLAHLDTGRSMAVDIFCLVGGKVRWDWPLYITLAAHVKQVALELDLAIMWGGDWKGRRRDGPHYELSRQVYP